MCVLYVYILCFIYHLLSTISRFNRISGVYADCDIYLHTGENCTKKKVFSTSTKFPLTYLSEGNSKHSSYCFFFIVRRCDTFLVTTPWMCVCVWEFMEVILCKWLPHFFFSRENYLNKWEYFFIFLQKMSVLLVLILYRKLVKATLFMLPKITVSYYQVFYFCIYFR